MLSRVTVTEKNMDEIRGGLWALWRFNRPLNVTSTASSEPLSTRLMELGPVGKGHLSYKLGTGAGDDLLERCVNVGDTMEFGSNEKGRFILRHWSGYGADAEWFEMAVKE